MSDQIVLLIEDELFIRELYERALIGQGFKVISAADGEEGILKAKTIPGLILLDIMLPKLNGIEVLKILKNDPQTKNIPIILLTNLGQESIIKNAFELGAQGYLMKMRITPQELGEKIKPFLDDPNYKMDPDKLDLE